MNILFGRCKTFEVNNAESTYKVHYLGNVMTSLLKSAYHNNQQQHKRSQSDELYNHSLRLNTNDYSSSLISNKDTYRNKLFGDNLKAKSLSTNSNQDEEEDDIDEESITTTESSLHYINNKSHHDSSNLKKKTNEINLNSVDKSVKILWDNHLKHNGHAGLKMKLTLTQGGLRVDTKDHGLTEYFGHRIHFIKAHPIHPKLFVWVYQHVGKNLKTEIRCHAALCQRSRDSRSIEMLLNQRIQQTFLEYKREKRRQQNSRLCNTKNHGLLTNQPGCKKRVPSRITRNYKPPVQHGMCSAPKLDDVLEEEEENSDESSNQNLSRLGFINNQIRKSFRKMLNKDKRFHNSDKKLIESDDAYYKNDKFMNIICENLDELAEDDEEKVVKEIENDSLESQEEGNIDFDEEDGYDADYENKNFQLKKPIENEKTWNEEQYDEEEEDYIFYNNSDATTNYEEAALQTTTTIYTEHHKIKSQHYDNRPITEQLILSSTSSSSSSASPNHHKVIENKAIINSSSFQNTSTSSSTISNVDSGIEDLNNKARRNFNIDDYYPNSNNHHSKVKEKNFTEVSYDFLSDLSKLNLKVDNDNGSKSKLKYSKSFNKQILKPQVPGANNKDNNFNPFKRSNISKSFSAFTTRLKQQAALSKQSHQNEIKEEDSEKSEANNQEIELKVVKNERNISNSSSLTTTKQTLDAFNKRRVLSNSLIQTNRHILNLKQKMEVTNLVLDSMSSRMSSSPTLSSCSISSTSSSSQQSQQLNKLLHLSNNLLKDEEAIISL